MMNTWIESYFTYSLLTMTQDVPLQKNSVLQLIPKFKIVSTVSLHLSVNIFPLLSNSNNGNISYNFSPHQFLGGIYDT